MTQKLLAALAIALLLGAAGRAQTPAGESSPAEKQGNPMGRMENAGTVIQEDTGRRCDPMCIGMMQGELAMRPWKIAGGLTLFTLAAASLVLLIVLQILWIQLWVIRLRQERTK
jgi:hypothetical protein